MTNTEYFSHYQIIEKLLMGFAIKLTRSEEKAKDLMQDTFLKSFTNRSSFEEGTYFKAWMTTIMYNNFVNGYRRLKTRNRIEKPIEEMQLVVKHRTSSENVQSVIMMKQLQDVVETLPECYRIPFMMYFEGYQYDEIADNMGIPLGTLKSRIFYAKRILRQKVKLAYGLDNPVIA